MNPYSYTFRRVTDLQDISLDKNISEIAEYSYIMLAYDGYNYKIPTKNFVQTTYDYLDKLNEELTYLIMYSNAHSQEADTSNDENVSVPEEKYIHLKYAYTYDSSINNDSDLGQMRHKRFTILSYGDYSNIQKTESSYSGSNYNIYTLTNGLVTGELLNTYMMYSLDTLLGVPGTLAYITEAIDSISEFAAWFEGVRQDSSYNALISYISSIDQSIIENYTSADNRLTNNINTLSDNLESKYNELLNRISQLTSNYQNADDELRALINTIQRLDSLEVNQIGNANTVISYVGQHEGKLYAKATNVSDLSIGVNQITGLDETLNSIQNLQEGNNISIDNNHINCYIGIDSANNSIKIGNASYILGIDNTGKLSLSVDIDTYVALSLNVSGGSTTSNEYNSTITASTVNLTASVNKSCDWGNWTTSTNAGVNTFNINGLTYTAKGTYGPITKGRQQTTYTWSISASHTPQPGSDEYNHGHTSVENKSGSTSISHKFDKFKIFCFPTTETIPANITINETNGLPDQIISNTYTKLVTSLPSNPIFSFTTNMAGRLCLILPAEWRTKPIKWTGTEGMGEVPGSSRQHIFSLYDGTKDYCTYLSASEYPIGTQINLKLE